MDINDQFSDEIAEQRLQEKMQQTGRGPQKGGKSSENFEPKEKRAMTDFPKSEESGRKAGSSKNGASPWQYGEKEKTCGNRTH